MSDHVTSCSSGGVVGGAIGAVTGLLADNVLAAVDAMPANWPAVACTLIGVVGGVLHQWLKNRDSTRRAEAAELKLSLANKRLVEADLPPV
jgi:LytS/YehU family sensor histidine kinase